MPMFPAQRTSSKFAPGELDAGVLREDLAGPGRL